MSGWITAGSLWIMDKTGLEVKGRKLFVLFVEARAFASNGQNFIYTIKIDDFLPFVSISTLDDTFNDNGCQSGEVNIVPIVLPEQMVAD